MKKTEVSNYKNPFQSLNKEHPDVTYLSQEQISLVISKGLATTFHADPKPQKPIEYFANWLLEYNKVQKIAKENQKQEVIVNKHKIAHQQHLKEQEKIKAEKDQAEALKEKKMKDFWIKVDETKDHEDCLQAFADHLHEHVGATGVYIGQLEHPNKQIPEDCLDENGHLDEKSAEVLKFKFANQDHQKLVVGKILTENEGITHQVFSENLNESNQKLEDEEVQTWESQSTLVESYKHLYLKEVVREPKMKYWDVPRFGCFMAVPLTYKSALSVPSLDQAFDEYVDWHTKVETQKAEVTAFNEVQQQIKAEKTAVGEDYLVEVKAVENIPMPVIPKQFRKFVVCLDTMGQDREFTIKQKNWIFSMCARYFKSWEELDENFLKADRDALLQQKDDDATIFSEEAIKSFEDLCEQEIKQKMRPPPIPDQNPDESIDIDPNLTFEEKQLITSQVKLQFYSTHLIKDKHYRARFDDLVNRKVVKYSNLIRAFFYFLEIQQDAICFKDSQKLFWKFAKHHWNDSLLKKMSQYVFKGPKTYTFKQYQTLTYVEKLIENLTWELVAKYNQALGLIYKWLIQAVKARKRDISQRLLDQKTKREERQQKIDEEAQRIKDRQQALQDAAEKFEVDNRQLIDSYQEFLGQKEAGTWPEDEDEPEQPLFDENFFLFNFEENNPQIVIPEEVIDDIDNDWPYSLEFRNDVIAQYVEEQQASQIVIPPPAPVVEARRR